MKKNVLAINFIFLLLFAYFEISAHSYVVTRSWCGGFFHRRFVAVASTGTMSYEKYSTCYNCIGQNVGCGWKALPSTLEEKTSRGCSRLQEAICEYKSGFVADRIWSGCFVQYVSSHPFTTYSESRHLLSGIQLMTMTTGRGLAGLINTSTKNSHFFISEVFDAGSSSVELNGNVYLFGNILSFENVVISLKSDGLNSFSEVRFVVFKENRNITDEIAEINEKGILSETFEDVVLNIKITFQNGEISINNIVLNEYFTLINDTIAELHIASLNIPVEVELNSDEELSFMAIADSGVRMNDSRKRTGNTNSISDKTKNYQYFVYPNPVLKNEFILVDSRNIKSFDGNVEIIDPYGKVLFRKRINSLDFPLKIDVNNFSSGTYLLRIIQDSDIFVEKIILIK